MRLSKWLKVETNTASYNQLAYFLDGGELISVDSKGFGFWLGVGLAGLESCS